MNREITTKKVGRQKKLTNPCPVIKGEVQIMVGSPKCITCQWFNIEIVYFGYYNPTIIKLQGEGLRIEGRIWYRMPLENLEGHEYLLGTAFWFPVSKEYNDNRIKILECALEDLERIKREGEPKLPPLTFEEPKIYP